MPGACLPGPPASHARLHASIPLLRSNRPPTQSVTLEIPFSVPPYMSLLARSVATLEGIALVGDPAYQMVAQVGGASGSFMWVLHVCVWVGWLGDPAYQMVAQVGAACWCWLAVWVLFGVCV